MKKLFFVLAAGMIGSQLQAQQDSTSLEEVVITSNKYPKKQSETGKVITIISREQLEKNGGRTLGELLNTVSGTTIIGANNILGTNQTVSIRGASAGNVLLLLDGIPVNDPSVISNYFDLNFISSGQVERIEILKGGQSTLYGSDAVAGVINIISKKPAAGTFNIYGDITGGSYNTLQQNLGFSTRGKQADLSFNYTHLGSDGFSTAYDENKTGLFDKDGIEQNTVSGKLGFQVSPKIKATLFSSYSRYKTDLDASAFTDDRDYTGLNKNTQAGTSIVYKHKLGSLHATYNYNRAQRLYIDEPGHISNPFSSYSRADYTGRTHFAEIYNSWLLKNIEILAGADYRFNNTDQSYYSTGSFGPYTAPPLAAKMNQFSPYLSLVYKSNTGFTTEIGGRFNKHSEYGNNFTFTFNPSYAISNKVKVFANLYSAFKTPTLYQLFDAFAGNAGLKPEKGMIAETGTSVTVAKTFRLRVVGFYRNTEDVIVYTYNPALFESKYLNVSEQKNYGAEFEINYSRGKLSIDANYTYTDGETTSAFDGTGSAIGKDTTYFNLYRIPKHAINFSLGVQATKAIFFRAQARSVSKREEFIYGSSPEILKGYSTIDLYGEYKFDKVFRLFLDLKNITNKEYFDIRGYNSRRFNFTTGVRFQL
ncbi:MAG: TonB-dependent receptor [Chitinophagales bacterium]|nr:TonB-dependent receptor [Chitinophagales bacterium]